MKVELQDQLIKKYPLLFKQVNLPMTQTCMCWGIDCGDGWYNIIDAVCDTIMRWERSNFPGVPEFTQVKEKYGTLQIYHQGDEWVSGVVALAEALSAQTCEVCGSPGKLYTDGWYSTRCEECRKK